MKLKEQDIRVCVERMAECESPNGKRGSFVTLTHVPTGIEVTKYHRVQIVAKGEALEELEKLVFNA